jgi:hypothetical protein
MTPDLTIAVPCFGTSPKWVAMLEVWLAHYLKSGCRLPVVVLTDNESTRDALRCRGDVIVYLFDPLSTLHILRHGQPFDIQGSLIVQAIRFLGPCVVMDSDALMLRDPTEEFLNLRASAALFGMAPDAGGRTLIVRGQEIPERNGGVLYFGPGAHKAGLPLAYQDAFAELVRDHPNNPLLTQFAWSVVWHRVGGDIARGALDIPRRLNHSRMWPMTLDVVIRHEHGNVKWQRIEKEAAHA